MPSLKDPWVWRTNSASSISSNRLKADRCGTVASPTPIVPISSDSTRTTSILRPNDLEMAAAHIHPAVPPPMMAIDRTRLSVFLRVMLIDKQSWAKNERGGALAPPLPDLNFDRPYSP